MLQNLYRHSSVTTTIGYQANFINKTADDAPEVVMVIRTEIKQLLILTGSPFRDT